MKMRNKKLLFPIDIKPDGQRGWGGGAYTLAFVYSPVGNFLIRGYLREVEDYIENTFTRAIVNYSLWHTDYYGKQHRDIWEFIGGNISLWQPDRGKRKKAKDRRWRFYDRKQSGIVLSLKRLPKAWIPEYDQMIDGLLKPKRQEFKKKRRR